MMKSAECDPTSVDGATPDPAPCSHPALSPAEASDARRSCSEMNPELSSSAELERCSGGIPLGKKKSKQRAKQADRSRRHASVPDDYSQFGPLTLARFGRFCVLQNDMTREQRDELLHAYASNRDKVYEEIDSSITEIVSIVARHRPDELLRRAYWEMARRSINVRSESELDQDAVISLRMVDYIQSIIASVTPSLSPVEQMQEADWVRLRGLVQEVFRRITNEFLMCETAARRVANPALDMRMEEYRVKAQMYWCNVRGDRYLCHDVPFLRDLLTPHSHVIEEQYGVTVDDILSGLTAIQESLTRGISTLMQDIERLRDQTLPELMRRCETQPPRELEEMRRMMDEVMKETNLEGLRDTIGGRLLGMDLFDLELLTGFPTALLDDLSFGPGEIEDFFRDGAYRGWPLRIWPIFQRPFLKLNGRYYCFDLYSLFDRVYRALERSILRRDTAYQQEWTALQKEASEDTACSLFAKILPGARMLRSVYYPKAGSLKERCECDALVMFDDHLFIVEIKAGKFSPYSPADDFEGVVSSLEGLIYKAAEQGSRFLAYLRSGDKVPVYDEKNQLMENLSQSSFQHITICTISVDPFTELACRVEHLREIGIDVGPDFVWAIALDDLRAYADLFDNPLMFLHFIEQRSVAFHARNVFVDDEFDHVGLYLRHNAYSEYARGVDPNGSVLQWHGYRAEIDGYFSDLLRNEGASSPVRRSVPPVFAEILDCLARSHRENRRRVSSMLLDVTAKVRRDIASGMSDSLDRQARTGRPSPLSISGELNVTVFCLQEGILERDHREALDHTWSVLLLGQEQQRLMFELTFDRQGRLTEVDFELVQMQHLPERERLRLEARAEALRMSRLTTAKNEQGEIGRNDPCPCGSGRKYKKCCMISRD